MKLIDKIRNIKVNSIAIIIVLVLMIVGVIGYGINYCFYSPSPINRYIASNLYETPANSYFEDDNFYQCVVDAYNKKNNTSLSYTTNLSDEQLASITRLFCWDEGITSADGVEKLIGLTSFNLGYNQLTSLDVSMNIALTELVAYHNQLTSLDVSKNTALTSLDVGGNELTSLDVSKNTALISLNVVSNKLTSLDVSNNIFLNELAIGGNEIASLDVSKNIYLKYLNVGGELSHDYFYYMSDSGGNLLTSLDLSKNEALTRLDAESNQLTSLDVSGATALTELYLGSNRLTSLDVSKNIALTKLLVGYKFTCGNIESVLGCEREYGNKINSLDITNNVNLEILDVSYNELTSFNISNNTLLKYLYASNNQITNLDVSNNNLLSYLIIDNNKITNLNLNNNITLTTLFAYNNQLTSLDVSKNASLATLFAYNNKLTNLDVSQNTALTRLRISSNSFNSNLTPMLLGDTLNIDNLEKMVILPEQLSPTITIKVSDGLEENDESILTTKAGTQSYVVTSKIGGYSKNYFETYSVEVVDIKSSKYDIDKTKDYIIVSNDDNDTILSNITVENGNAIIEDGYLLVKNGEDEVKRFKLIKFSSSIYDLNNDYIYVGNDTDEEIKNNIEATADISIDDNILNITYGDTYNVSYKLIRLNTEYDISNGYIYTFDKNYLDNIDVINGNKEIVDNDLVIKYNDIELDRIPILYVYSDNYIIKEDYIYTGLSDIDLNKINKHNDLNLSVNDNKLILTYKDNTIDEIPYYYLISNSNEVRFSTVNNKIYVKNTMMTYNQLLQYIVFNTGGQSLMLFDQNGSRISDNNILIEEGSYITLYTNLDMKHIIEVNTEYVEYKVDANVHYTTEYGVDIIKNLNNNNTFINVRELIDTDGELSILDKEDNILEDASNIKTGYKVVVTFPSSNKHYIYLSVKGDVTGRGNISNEDVLESYSILRGSKVEDYYRLASDINDDGKVKINDVARLYQFVNKKIVSLED